MTRRLIATGSWLLLASVVPISSVGAQEVASGTTFGLDRFVGVSVSVETVRVPVTDDELRNEVEITSTRILFGLDTPRLTVGYIDSSGASIELVAALRSTSSTVETTNSEGTSTVELDGFGYLIGIQAGYVFDLSRVALWPRVGVGMVGTSLSSPGGGDAVDVDDTTAVITAELKLLVPIADRGSLLLGPTVDYGTADSAPSIYGFHIGALFHFGASGGRSDPAVDTWEQVVPLHSDDATREHTLPDGVLELGLDLSGDGFELNLTTIPARDGGRAHLKMGIPRSGAKDCPLRVVVDTEDLVLRGGHFDGGGAVAEYTAEIPYGDLRRMAGGGSVTVRTCQYAAVLTDRQRRRIDAFVERATREQADATRDQAATETTTGATTTRGTLTIPGEGWELFARPTPRDQGAGASLEVRFDMADARDCPLRIVVDGADLVLSEPHFDRMGDSALYRAHLAPAALQVLADGVEVVVRTCQYGSTLERSSLNSLRSFARSLVEGAASNEP